MTSKLSNGPSINTELCVEQVGGNKYNLVLIAAQRAREIARQHRNDAKFVKGPVDALLEIQEGKVDPLTYLQKVR